MLKIRTAVLCLLIVLAVGILFVLAGPNANADDKGGKDMCVPMGMIVLKPDASVKQKKTSVDFHHSKHFIYDCKACHHKWDGKTQITGCATSNCHDLLKAPAKPTKYLEYTDEGIKYFKYAFHQKCVGCHKEIKEERKKMEMSYQVLGDKLPKTGPTGCKECHPK